jgi:regulatory protein
VIQAEISKKLMNRAGRLLGRRAYSRGEMRLKLLRDAEAEQVDSVLDRLEELKLLNDEEYAYNFALCRMVQEGWGPLKARQALIRRQITPQVADAAVDRARGSGDEAVMLRVYLDRISQKGGLPQDRKGIQKLISHLRRRGFYDVTIFRVLRQLVHAAAWRCFEIGD